jgi:hypothetical protein
MLKSVGTMETKDLSVSSGMEIGHIVAVALDGQPLAISRKILLQVMSEEKSYQFQTEPAGGNLKRIANIGMDPWMVKELKGTVRLKRPDAHQLKVTTLDFNGYPAGSLGSGSEVQLQPRTLYYLLTL